MNASAIKKADGKGDCFEAAARLLLGLELPEGCTAEVVHGIVTGSEGTGVAGVRFTHAWVEVALANALGQVVLDRSNGRKITLPAAFYYELGRIRAEETVRYAKDELKACLLRYEHFGPWDGAPGAHVDPEVPEVRRRCAP